MKNLCVFDLDGTLVDSIADISSAINSSLKKMGKPVHPQEAYYHMVGNGMKLLCQRALGETNETEVQKLINLYQKEYLENCCINTYAYPGINVLLSELKSQDIKLAVLSNKPQEQTERVLAGIFPDNLFDCIIGHSPKFPPKPSPESLLWIMQNFTTSTGQVWYIGDSDVDMQLGRYAGVDTIGVAWGFRGENELRLAGATYIARTAEELKALLYQE